jgi:hypothetical protein
MQQQPAESKMIEAKRLLVISRAAS